MKINAYPPGQRREPRGRAPAPDTDEYEFGIYPTTQGRGGKYVQDQDTYAFTSFKRGYTMAAEASTSIIIIGNKLYLFRNYGNIRSRQKKGLHYGVIQTRLHQERTVRRNTCTYRLVTGLRRAPNPELIQLAVVSCGGYMISLQFFGHHWTGK